MGNQKIECIECGFLNPPQAKLCLRCQSMLRIGTQKIEEDDNLVGTPKFGSVNTGKKVYFHVHGSNEFFELELEDGMTAILGRKDPNTSTFPELDFSKHDAAEKGVSRQHAKIIYQNNALKIADLNSSNYTYLNGQKLVSNQARILRDGDEVMLGRLQLTIQFA